MSLHELMKEFVAWLVGQPREPEPIRVPVKDEPKRRPRR